MPVIQLFTRIHAPVERCFDLSRSIDLHQISTADSGEKAVAGRTQGLIELGEQVTWRARHFGVWQELTSRITALEYPVYFRDEMVSGAFASFEHEHFFESVGAQTHMRDVFHFESPGGWLGRWFNRLVLNDYMRKLLTERNRVIREFAETDRWKEVPGM